MAQKDDLKKIQELLDIMKANELVEIEISHGNDKILLKRAQPQQNFAHTIAHPIIARETIAASNIPQAGVETAAESKDRDNIVEIKSPLVGTFYAKPSPDSESYVDIGSKVQPQTVVCIIEAMKVMNEIKAETAGTITEILVKNGQAVEYGQVLFRVKPE